MNEDDTDRKFSSGNCKILSIAAGNTGLHGQVRVVRLNREHSAMGIVAEVNFEKRGPDCDHHLHETSHIRPRFGEISRNGTGATCRASTPSATHGWWRKVAPSVIIHCQSIWATAASHTKLAIDTQPDEQRTIQNCSPHRAYCNPKRAPILLHYRPPVHNLQEFHPV